MGSPEYKIYGPDNKYAAACRSTEHAAVLANYIGDGAQIRFGHEYMLFRRGSAPISHAEIVRQIHRKETELRLLHYLQPNKVYSIVEVISLYPANEQGYIIDLILELGDSRRPNRALDLGRDDRPEWAMTEEERKLMPREPQAGGRAVYYCTMQKRKGRQ